MLPLFEFEAPTARIFPSLARTSPTPLRSAARCAYMGAHAPPRHLANTFWADGPAGHFGFNYTAAQLPVTDTLRPWVPLLADMNPAEAVAGDDLAVLQPELLPVGRGQAARAAELRRFHLTQPFGGTLAVFAYASDAAAGDGGLRAGGGGSAARRVVAAAAGAAVGAVLDACGEAEAAADACCV